MIDSDTAGIITAMQDGQPVRNRPIRPHPRQAMGAPVLCSDTEKSVSEPSRDGKPEPARFSLANLRPESFLYTFSSHVTSLGSLVRSAARNPLLPRFVIVREGLVV